MAIYSGRILARRGANSEFDPDKMLAGEWAVTTDEYTRYIYMCFEPGVVKRVATYEDFLDKIDEDTATIQTLLDTLHLNIDSLENLLVDKLAINDSTVSTAQGWSSSKIKSEIDKVVDDTTKSSDKAYSNTHMDELLANLKTTIKAEMEAEQNAKKYPIGAVVMGDCWDTEAKVIAAFGGTEWVQLEQGRAIVSAGENYESGSNYGSNSITLAKENLPSHNHTYSKSTSVAKHVLTVDEIPEHNHGLNGGYVFSWGTDGLNNQVSILNAEAVAGAPQSNNLTTSQADWNRTAATGGGKGHSHSLNSTNTNTSSVGSAQAIDITPSSVAFYIWKRTV